MTKGADAGRNDTALKRAGWARPGRSRVRSLAAAGFLLLLASLLALPMQAQAKTVTTDWGLVESGLGEGDWFRLVVVTSGTRNETVTNIAAYNTFVQNDVSTTGHTDTTSHSSSFKVLGCTSSTSAITNTSTGSSDTSAPIYWLGGLKVSDAYADLYDNSWHSNVPTSGITSRTFTGCLDDGQNSQKFHLGEASQVTQGYPANQGFEVSRAGSPPGNPQNSYGLSGTRPMYGVSEVFQVGDTSSDATLSGLALENASDDSGVTLNEMFASTTTFYTADVANDVDKVTIKPTLSDSNAAYVFLDDSDAELTDSDTTKDNFQVALAEGLNTIKVKVTAENDMSIEIYTVVVTREPSTRVLVSNTGQDADGQKNTGSIGGFLTRNAQRFTTGSNTGGYTLEEVKISLTDVGANSVPVITINAGNGVNPGTVLYNLTNPTNLLSDTNIFTPPADATLSADTNYFVVMENSNTDNNNAGRYGIVLTSDNSEENVGLSDWSIADIGRRWGNVSFGRAFKIRLSGTVEPSEPIPASTDAALSGLSVNDGTSDLILTPGFVSDTYVYAADVGNAVEEVTLSATVNDDGAEVSGVTLDGTAVADTDFTDGITVPSLVVGDNVIVVTVTAEETSIILTYSITVTRATIAPGAPTDLRATAAGETRINLSWRAPTSDGGATISGYKVEVSLTGTSDWSDLVANTGATDTTYSHTGLSAGNTRHYRVKAINSAGTGSASDVAGATTAAANVLVSNTGQTVDRRLLSAIGSRNKTYSQGFETGTNPGGYSLASVGVYVYVETLGTGETFTVHIYTANSAGAPDTLAYTLTSPGSYADGAVNTFTAPAGATLDADTDYFVVFEGTADASLDFILGLTSSDEQDRGSRSGWEIEDTNRYQGGLQTAGNSYQISVNGSAVPTDVPSTWALKPTGLTASDTFRLLFLSSTKRDASSTDIADYNTFIQTTAAAGHTAIQGYSDGFRVVGCTGSVDARDNTLTVYTTSDKGLPIYWLSGAKAADDYEDFYDGDWDEEANDKNESGTDGPDTSQLANYPWTGCNHDGTEEFDSLGGSEALGGSLVSFGRPNDAAAGNGPLDSSAVATSSNTRPFYGLSEIFQVVAGSASNDATLSALAVNDGTNDLTLAPAFAPGTYIYAAEVGNAVDEVTLTAAVNHSSAEVSGVTLAGITIADSDFTNGITVPSLVVGDNVIVVTVTAEDDSTTQTYTVTVTLVAGNSAAIGKPTISGAAQVGMTLTAGAADIMDADGLGSPGYTYQWLRASSDISGATSNTYTLITSDYGEEIQVKVSFTDDSSGAETLTSDETLPVAPAATACPTDAATVWCATLTVGHPLDEDGDPEGSGFEARSGRDPFGSVSLATFRHLGVDYTVDFLTGASLHDLYLATTPHLPLDGAGLTVHVQTYGGELAAPLADGSFDNSSYWLFGGVLWVDSSDPLSDVPLIRTLKSNFTRVPPPPDIGTEVTVRLSYANRDAEGAPAISGTAQVGATLTASTSGITDADGLTTTTYTYQWIRVDGGTETPIPGATFGTYVPVSADVGKKVKVEVEFTDDGGNDETLESDAYPASGTIIAAVVGTVSVNFGSSTYSAAEGGSVTVTVQLSDTPSSQVTIQLTRRNRGGASNADYFGFQSSLTFGTSDTSKTFTLAVTDDSIDDDGESVEFGFGSLPSGVTTGSPSIATVSLLDNDSTIPTVTFGSSSYTAREGGSAATVAVDLSEAPSGSVTIQLTKTPLGGASGEDYSGVPSSVTFTSGQTRRTFTVTATDDSDDDDGERVRIGFDTLPSGYAQGTRPTATVHLQDNDTTGLPIVSIASASTTEGQDIVFTVTISPPISGFRRLSYGTGSDSIPSGSKAATAGTDYVTPHTASKVIQIGYGLTSVEIRFRTIDDDLVEGTEVFGIGLYGSSVEGREYSVGTRTAIGTIRDNDNSGQRYVDKVRGNTSTSASISVGSSVTGRIEEVSDADWYRTSLTAGHCYRIGVAGSSDSDSLTLPYPALYGMYKTDSTRISGTSARADYAGNKAISHVELDTSGTYYISVGIHRFLGEGTYRLSLSDLGTSNTSCCAAKAGAIAGPLEISVADASKREWPNPQAYLAFDVTLDRDADEEVRVDYATVNGTAVAGQDYESQSGTLVFGTGEDSKRIWVPIQFDREDEETETMTLRLSNASGAQIRRGAAIGSIYDYSTRGC